MKFYKLNGFAFFTFILLFITACGGGGGGGSESGGTGTLAVSLTDSAGQYKALYITIADIEVHTGGNDNSQKNWLTIEMENEKDTINLCELTNGVFEYLGSIRLDAGRYTQISLHLDNTQELNEQNILSQPHPFANYVILEDNTQHELKIPSGSKTGVKIVKGFTVSDNSTTEIILDFDAMSSVVEAGDSGQWILKPTIKIGEISEYSIINGIVTDKDDQGISNAYVSAQIYDADAQDEKDKVIVQAGTITDDEGCYSLFLKPGTYNLVATADGKDFEFVKVETVAGQVLENSDITDFQLVDASAVRTDEGAVSINGTDDSEQYATISYRQDADCFECVANEMVEIKSVNVLDGAKYEVGLPQETYHRVASTLGYKTLSITLFLTAEADLDDIQF